MSLRNTTQTYGSVAKFFHWSVSVLVITMLAVSFFMGDVPEDWKGFTYNTHKLVGLTILTLVVLRFFWRLINPTPAFPGDMPTWQRKLAHLVHYALYLFVFLMPVAGWVGSVAGGRPPHLGDFMFNLPIAENKPLAKFCFEAHEIIAYILIALISVHVLAALYHHLVHKDNVLKRMLPGNRL